METVLTGDGVLDAEMALRPVSSGSDPVELLLEVRGVAEEFEVDRRPLLRTIVENVPVVLFALDADGTFLLSEGKGLESIGLEPGEVVGESVFDVYDDNETVRETCRRALEGERAEAVVEVAGTALETWFHPVREGGEVTLVIGAGLDVTDLQERKRELARQNERLEEFASIVSHDLRNPLNVARGGIELLEDDPTPEAIARVREALDRMDTIVEEVLRLARSGEAVEATEPVALDEVVESAWRSVETSEATLSIVDDATLVADPERLQRLFENLLANAVTHAREGPENAGGRGEGVTVTVGRLEAGFYVADDGPGIPTEERDVVFAPAYTTAEDGTGFGLSIVREIAKAHGWDVSIAESDAGGARFDVTGVRFV